MKQIYIKLFLLMPLLLVMGCTQMELGAHVGKQVYSDSKSKGTFKVGSPYTIKGKRYTPKEDYHHTEVGVASWYGPNFHGKKTANGEIFNKYELTAAHRTLQMPSIIEVTNLRNGKSIILRVNDRGPFAHNRVLDVSERAAELLEFKKQGVTKVRIEVLTEESRQVAEIAKGGQSTRGMEVAYNEKGRLPGPDPFTQSNNIQTASLKSEPIQSEVLHDPFADKGRIASDGRFMPDPIVKNTINPTGKIYVQAGSFGNPNNAHTLSGRLDSIATSSVMPVDINGDMFHRVRLGPFTEMAQAQSVLNKVAATGQSNAIIVVD